MIKNKTLIVDLIESWSGLNKEIYNIFPDYYKEVYFFNASMLNNELIDNSKEIKFFKKYFPKKKIIILNSVSEAISHNYDSIYMHTTDISDYIIKNFNYKKLISWKHNEYTLSKGEYKSKIAQDIRMFEASDFIWAVDKRDIENNNSIFSKYIDKCTWIDNSLFDFKKYKKSNNKTNDLFCYGHDLIRKQPYFIMDAFDKFNKKAPSFKLHAYTYKLDIPFFYARYAFGKLVTTNSNLFEIINFYFSYVFRPKHNKNIAEERRIEFEEARKRLINSKGIIINSHFDASSVAVREAIALGCPVFANEIAAKGHELEEYVVLHKNKKELISNLNIYLNNEDKFNELLKKISEYNLTENQKEWEQRLRNAIEAVNSEI